MPTTNDYFLRVGAPGTATTLSAPGYTAGGTTINVASTGNFPNDTAVIFGIDTVSLSSGTQVRNANSYCVFVGIVTSATSIGSVTLLSGTPQNYAAAATTRVYITVSSVHTNRLISGILQHANQDGSLKTTAVQNALGLGTSSLNGWNVLGATPSSVTANGNRSYTMTFNGSDQTGTLSPGMRLRTTRTVAAPTQCTSLNGTSQYFSKTAPAGMTFTNNWTAMTHAKLSSYPSGTANIQSRLDATGIANGWALQINSAGQVVMIGRTDSSANYKIIQSYQSIPLNKQVHIAAAMDVSGFTSATCAIYIDGISVPISFTSNGTITAITQGTDYVVGARTGGADFLPGKLAQTAVFSAILPAATINTYKDQSLTGTEPNLISAYSFNNTVNDLNTTNANNLTANGSAVATNADSPYGGQADGTSSSTLDYGIVQKATFSTNTTVVVQVAEGCTIPTSGGVAAVAYSPNKVPYGFPGQKAKWSIFSYFGAGTSLSLGTTPNTWYSGTTVGAGTTVLNIPAGEWIAGYDGVLYGDSGSATTSERMATLSTSPTTYSDLRFSQHFTVGTVNANSFVRAPLAKSGDISVSTNTPYYVLGKSLGSASNQQWASDSGYGLIIKAENAYL